MIDNDYNIRDIYLSSAFERKQLQDFLAKHELTFEEDSEGAVGVFDHDDNLVACGCFTGKVLKQFAVTDCCRGQNFLGSILSQLMQQQFARGYSQLFVFTKPQNMLFFQQNGFYPVATTTHAALLENSPNGIRNWAKHYLVPHSQEQKVGAIVMNANPFTRGHQWLVQQAASQCDLLYVFVVEEDRSVFPFSVRLQLVQEGLKDFANVLVCASGPYMISQASFPSYFIKDKTLLPDIQAELDLTIFAESIAPLLAINVRFVGSEPLCSLTRAYNETMQRCLPAKGIAVCTIKRKEVDSIPISASLVRTILKEHGPDQSLLKELLPPVTLTWLQSASARTTLYQLQQS